MKLKAMFKDFLRELKRSSGRFISIMLIVFLGSGFFVGVKATAPSMKKTSGEYFSKNNLMDISLLSTFGIGDDDISEIEKIDGVVDAMPSYSVDAVLVNDSGDNEVVHVVSIPGDIDGYPTVNKIRLVKGRMPEKPGECVAVRASEIFDCKKVGTELFFSENAGSTNILDCLTTNSYVIVGIVESPMYFSYTYGSSSLGEGEISAVIMVNADDFIYPRYTELCITVDYDIDNFDVFSKDYSLMIQDYTSKISSLCDDRFESFIVTTNQQIKDGEVEIEEQSKYADEQLAEAKKQLDDGYQQMLDGEQQLQQGWKDYNDGLEEYENQIAEAEKQLEDGRAQLEQGEIDYQNGLIEYENGIKRADKELAEALETLEAGKQQYSDGEASLESGFVEYEEGLAKYEAGLAEYNENKALFDEKYAEYEDGIKQYEEGKAALEESEQKYKDGLKQYEDGLKKIEEAKKQIEEGKTAYEDGLVQYNEGYAEYEAGLAEYEAGLKEFQEKEAEFNEGKAQYEDGVKQIEDNEALLEDAKAQYESGLSQIEDGKKQIEDAKVQYEDGKKQLEDGKSQLETAELYYSISEAALSSAKQKYENAKDELDSLDPSSSAYIRQASRVAEYEVALKTAQEEFNEIDSQIKDAKAQIADGERQLEEAEKQIKENEKLIEDSQEELDNAAIQIADGEVELENAKIELKEYEKQIKDGEKQLEAGRKELEKAKKQIDNAKKQLEDSKAELDEAKKKIEDGEKEIAENEKLLAESKKELDAAPKQIEDGKKQLAEAKAQIDEATPQIEDGQRQLDDAAAQLAEAKKQIDDAYNQLSDGQKQLADNEQKIKDGEQQYKEAQADTYKQLEDAKKQLEEARATLDENKQKLIDGEKLLEESKISGKKQLEEAYQQLLDSTVELADAKTEYEAGLAKYQQSEEAARQQIANGYTMLESARKTIAEMSTQDAQWYAFPRSESVTNYSGLNDDANRIDAIADIFPVFFMLVAALVCLTTMSRMVEEQRTQLGAYKALGYSSEMITRKYFLYSLSASVIGSVSGMIICTAFFPQIIVKAYTALYQLPKLTITVPWYIPVISFVVSLACTTLVTLITCRNTLKITTAALMRPKAPKLGKKILLEKIKPLWSAFGFQTKITARNLFRYKSRLIMTVIGIGGCMALIVSGLGLQNAISPIVDYQFNDIYNMNVIISLSTQLDEEETEQLTERLTSDGRLTNIMYSYEMRGTAKNLDESVLMTDVIIFVPESNEKIADMINLRNYSTKKNMNLDDSGAILTEKLAKDLGVSVGDSIKYSQNGEECIIPVAGIVENYVYHYIYISPKLYTELFKEAPANNVISGIISDEVNNDNEKLDKLKSDILTSESCVLTVTPTTMASEAMDETLESLNIVILIMIISAGALAFVVVYNLTNINISERIREIATIKVLGFKKGEVNMYVFRENLFMCFLGIVFGALGGYFLAQFMINTIEVDMVMFSRTILPTSYIYASLLTAGFTVLVNLIMMKKMEKISMVESLKAIE